MGKKKTLPKAGKNDIEGFKKALKSPETRKRIEEARERDKDFLKGLARTRRVSRKTLLTRFTI